MELNEFHDMKNLISQGWMDCIGQIFEKYIEANPCFFCKFGQIFEKIVKGLVYIFLEIFNWLLLY